ncbi:Protein translocase subunit SecE [Olavius algarvensis associated proteobacterium Delta 3]|nr:Protein translocase subunit SecE [Olavius algarvensis associated proteobacterium Delta 3]CAB5108268.1 Protein translocase subunit SecE [Olavius algarvensis associated proteobacterium Delta 3]
MGRLPKKKSTAKKKKKQHRVTAGSGAATSGAAVAPAPLASADGKDTKKRGPAAPPRKPAVPSKATSGEPNVLQKSIQFLREVKVELKKVTWPSRKQTIGSTVVVIVLVIIISSFLGLVDMGLSSLVRVVLQ